MAKQTLTAKLKNLARGGENYRHLRWSINLAISERPGELVGPMSPFLSRELFSLSTKAKSKGQRRPYLALPFMNKDWEVLERLINEPDVGINHTYLQLLSDYIRTNAKACERMAEVEKNATKAVMGFDPDAMVATLAAIAPEERQSLFTFKYFCAMHAPAPGKIAEFFVTKPHSDWVKQRLLYPLIFLFINLPSDTDFEHVLGQILPKGEHSEAERAVVRFLTRGGSGFSWAFKAYVALLCHPFDALDIFNRHLEEAMAAQEPPIAFELTIAREIAQATNNPRLKALLGIHDGDVPPFTISPRELPICKRLDFDTPETQFLEDYLRTDDKVSSGASRKGVFENLARLRWSAYPHEEDYFAAVAVSARYGFCEAGRLTDVLLTSIYMVERREVLAERRNLIRHIDYFGSASPFTICSPRGSVAVAQGMFGDRVHIEACVDNAVEICREDTRWWIKKLHWKLRTLERSMRVGDWLREVRAKVRLSGNSRYLSGIDWAWIDQVIAASRIRPFLGNPDGIYVLLLRAMEQRQKEPNSLKLALTPAVPTGAHVADLLEWLFREFKESATAFIRFFLTPPMILKMKLENSYTAALSERLNALDQCIEAYGYDAEIITETQHTAEAKALITALTFMTFGAAQFEVSWEALKADAEDEADQAFKTYAAVNQTYQSLSLLTETVRTTQNIFANKQVQAYEFKNKDWPLVSVICAMIDAFLSSASNGIEAILAIRIRHDNLRREFTPVFNHARKAIIPDVSSHDCKLAADQIELAVNVALQGWIDKYMHTPRGAPTGLFDFVPTQKEMVALVQGVGDCAELPAISECVVHWLRSRLEASLVVAREKLSVELRRALRDSVEEARDDIILKGVTGELAAGAVAAIIQTSLSFRIDELIAWFQFPGDSRPAGLTFKDIKLAVEGRFSSEVLSGELVTEVYAPTLIDYRLKSQHIRPAFDLWSELITNAVKYSARKHTKVRITEYEDEEYIGLRFTSYCDAGGMWEQSFVGEPRTAHDSILGSGKSGLPKVSALAAALVGKQAQLKVFKRKRSFHVFVPLTRKIACQEVWGGL